MLFAHRLSSLLQFNRSSADYRLIIWILSQVSRRSCPVNLPPTKAWWESSRLRTSQWLAPRVGWPIRFKAWWCSTPPCLLIRWEPRLAFITSRCYFGILEINIKLCVCVCVRCLCSRDLRTFRRQPISNRLFCRGRPIRRPPTCRCITACCHQPNTLPSGNASNRFISTNQVKALSLLNMTVCVSITVLQLAIFHHRDQIRCLFRERPPPVSLSHSQASSVQVRQLSRPITSLKSKLLHKLNKG